MLRSHLPARPTLTCAPHLRLLSVLALVSSQGAPSDWDYEKWKAGGEVGADFRLKEWWQVRRLRPPPPPPPDGWSTQLEVGDEVNIDFEGGW